MVHLDFHHIGIATKNISRAKKLYENMGYSVSEVMYVPSQKVNVCFANKGLHPTIEIIEPADSQSPVQTFLDKVGSTPYHLCYRTTDLKTATQELKALSFMPIGSPFVSGPLSNQTTCFFYNVHIGLIEVTEETLSHE